MTDSSCIQTLCKVTLILISVIKHIFYTFSKLHPFLISSFRLAAAIPYFLASLALLILTSLGFVILCIFSFPQMRSFSFAVCLHERSKQRQDARCHLVDENKNNTDSLDRLFSVMNKICGQHYFDRLLHFSTTQITHKCEC